jgi:hypothetical protein
MCLLAWGFPLILAALPYSTGTAYDSVGPFCWIPLKPSECLPLSGPPLFPPD